MNEVSTAQLDRIFREEYGRAVAVLTGVFGDIDLAEDAVQDAFVVASDRWRDDGVPPSPAGWIVTTARRRAIDRLRRDGTRPARHADAVRLRPGLGAVPEPRPAEAGVVADDRLRLIFTCCHPALAPASQVALTLRLLGGLGTDRIACTYLVPESTMAQRISRAKRKIRDARIPFRIPTADELPERIDAVRAVLYLVYTSGHTAGSGASLVDTDLCVEAVRLTRLLAELLPTDPETAGLLALMLFSESRRGSRTTADGRPVLLAEQDRTRWDRTLVRQARSLVRWCLERNRPGPYQVQAAIAAVHSDAPTFADTDWSQIVRLYDHLYTLQPTPVVALHRAIAVGETDGAAVALDLVDALDLDRYHVFHAARADLLRRLGRLPEAAEAYDRAAARTGNTAEREFLHGRRDEVSAREGIR